MRVFWIAVVCLGLSAPALTQSADNEPASRDDVILYLRTMHSHDLMQKTVEVQSRSMQQLLYEQMKEKGTVPADFETHMKKAMDDLVKSMPYDDITQAMIPSYQKHFTKSDIAAMNAFYSSPVGQKVLEELPAVMQEGSQAAMPIMSKYLSEWRERMEKEMKEMEKSAPAKSGQEGPAPQN